MFPVVKKCMTLVSLVPRLSCGHKSLGMRLDLIVPTDKLLWHIFLLKKGETQILEQYLPELIIHDNCFMSTF